MRLCGAGRVRAERERSLTERRRVNVPVPVDRLSANGMARWRAGLVSTGFDPFAVVLAPLTV